MVEPGDDLIAMVNEWIQQAESLAESLPPSCDDTADTIESIVSILKSELLNDVDVARVKTVIYTVVRLYDDSALRTRMSGGLTSSYLSVSKRVGCLFASLRDCQLKN